jgi:crotonobetainyl-CoA:carnitine CoA-transferase CaiB-like acyl-CoA transferase
MLGRADIFVQNLAPGATGRLGLGSAELRSRHPRLIVCDISGYTAGTPMHERKAYDLLIQAETGLAFVTGSEGSGANRVGISICDISTGHAAYEAILEARILRGRPGKGSHIQLSLFDTMADFMNVPYLTRRYGGREPRRLGLAHPSIAPYGVFHLADGDIVIAVQSDGEWKILCTKVLEDEALAGDPRFDTNVKRTRNRDELDTLLQARFSAKTMNEVTARLDRARIAYGRISTVSDLMRHASASIVPVETPEGTAELLAPPAIVDGKRAKLGRVPRLGEHDEALRSEFAHE